LRIDGKSIVVGSLIGLLVGLVLPINLLDLFAQSSNMEVTVVEGHPASVKVADYEYYFAYTPANYSSWFPSNATFTVTTEAGLFAMKTFNAIDGATYKAYGIEIVVSEVHSDYIILLVKSTVT